MRHRLIHLVLLLLAAMVGASAAPRAAAGAEPSREYQVKAAFLFRFVQFVTWPDDAFEHQSSPYVLGVFAQHDPFEGTLEQVVSGKAVNGRGFVVRHIRSTDDVAALRACHLLFVARTEDDRLRRLFGAVGAAPVLTVGETDAFPWAGGCVRFFTEDNKVRFEISPDATSRAGLKVSSKLLQLARIFRGGAGKGNE